MMSSGEKSATENEPAPTHLDPDEHAHGFLKVSVDPLRYDGQLNDPDEVVGVLIDLMPEQGRVLDVGCGTGSVSAQILANRGITLVGVEPDDIRATKARERGVDTRTSLLSPELISELGKFDVVLFADVLEHLPDPYSMLQLAKTALAPGGRIIASVPNIAHWSVRTELARGKFEYRKWGIMDATHLRWFTDSTLRQLFNAAGLEVERRRVTAGIDLDCYLERWPWTTLSRSFRSRFVRRAIRYWPELFGCQLVVRSAPVFEGAGS